MVTFMPTKQAYKLHLMLFYLSFFSVVLGHRAYFASSGRIVPFFYFVVGLVFLYCVYRYSKLLLRCLPISFWLFVFALSVYPVFSYIIYSREQDLIQLEIYLFLPVVFCLFGLTVSVQKISNAILIGLLICAVLSFAQIAYTGFNNAGPFGLFALLKEQEYLIQDEVLKRTLSLRATGVFVEPNMLGLFAGSCLFWFMQVRQDVVKKTFLLGISLAFFSLIASMSRGSIAAVLVGLGVRFLIMLPSFRFNRSFIYVLFGGSAAFSMLMAVSDVEQFSRVAEIGDVMNKGAEGAENLQARFSAWDVLIDFVFMNPMGSIQPPLVVVEESPDNQFLYFALQGGFVLFFLAAFFFFENAMNAAKLVLKRKSEFLGSIVFLGINCFTIPAMTSFAMVVFWLSFGFYAKEKCFPVLGNRAK